MLEKIEKLCSIVDGLKKLAIAIALLVVLVIGLGGIVYAEYIGWTHIIGGMTSNNHSVAVPTPKHNYQLPAASESPTQ